MKHMLYTLSSHLNNSIFQAMKLKKRLFDI